MKKTYINPEINLFELKGKTAILINSVEGFKSGLNNTAVDGGSALGRGGSSWDDDDDE